MCCIVIVGYPLLDMTWVAFPQGTQAAGGSVKVPLNLLKRIILEGELSEQKEQANQSVNSLSLFSPCDCLSGAVNCCSNTRPPYVFLITP